MLSMFAEEDMATASATTKIAASFPSILEAPLNVNDDNSVTLISGNL